ncbi:sulfotransferase domain-containing protein [Halomonas ventosae]|uniref:Sulfotransferase domain-containing protein n=1 Tax=Halomonas ventosae TaxID=229007 RepID=A0A2T0VBD7_9GAMM|nr:sulfotransferase domain-containing protein [Halomonas ventosae]PRY67378.1 sulfotransferase domain-containing protein [Halomonas ventosae]
MGLATWWWSRQNSNVLVSYPKSGRTWLRALVGKYFSLKYQVDEDALFSSKKTAARYKMPRITHDGASMKAGKHYSEIAEVRNGYAGQRVIFLSRDVKDTLVSAYFQAIKRIAVFDGSISEFVRSEYFGAHKIMTFLDAWSKSKQIPDDFLWVSYEGLQENAEDVLEEVLKFLGEETPNRSIVEKAVAHCSFSNMKTLEKNSAFTSSALKAGNLADDESYKVRKGQVGGYREYLNEEDITYVDEIIEYYGFSFDKLGQGR